MSCNNCSSCSCTSSIPITQIIGQRGADGSNGWTALYAVIVDGDRSVLQVSGWTGGVGIPPSFTGYYLGVSGYVPLIADASDIRGLPGDSGTGSDGEDGWSAITACIEDPGDSSRSVLQVVDWEGGTGTKPSVIDRYLGITGFVSTPGAATNVRGTTGEIGATGETGEIGPIGPTGPAGAGYPTQTGNAGKVLSTTGSAVQWVNAVHVGSTAINLARTESSGAPHIDSEATIFTIITPNDGITRDYHIILMSVIDASTGASFGYNSYFKISTTYYSSNLVTIESGDEISYTHNDVLLNVPPGTTILIRDKRSASTTGTVNLSKLTYQGFAK